MRITGLGHAGLYIETRFGTILCDPWVNPAYFGSWIPFPDNRQLEWDSFLEPDYVYISHRHEDHLDPALLDRVSKNAYVLLPDFPTADLERSLRALGFREFIRCIADSTTTLGGLTVQISPQRAPGDGPIGDSAIAVSDGRASILNQNDSHPVNTESLTSFGAYDAHFIQHSGAIWWPMVYDLPFHAKLTFAAAKRSSQFERAFYYIKRFAARTVFPFAGPPCFLLDELFNWNGEGKDNEAIFVSQWSFLQQLAARAPEIFASSFLPGTVVTVGGDSTSVENTIYSCSDRKALSENFWDYLEEQKKGRAKEVLDASQAPAADLSASDIFAIIKNWWEPLMQRAPTISNCIRGGVRLKAGPLDILLTFEDSSVIEYDDRKVRYWFDAPFDLVAHLATQREVDWVTSLFLSMRFTAGRIGKFNEQLNAFFGCLSEERIDYVEGWYGNQGTGEAEVELGDWVVQRYCPHMGADLALTGTVSDDILVCTQHNWSFDLRTGECMTGEGYGIRARRSETRL